jgi:hypothetical protein
MISTQIILPILAFGATFSALATGVDVTKDLLAPAQIEGAGFYNQTTVPGETIVVEWIITKRTDCPGYSSRVWSGADGFFLSEHVQATAIPVSTRRAYKIPTTLPSMAPAGKLDLMIKGHFECENQPRDHFTLGPVVFNVVGASDLAGR